MARVHYVKAARASRQARRCHGCSKEIKVGDPYKWFANRIGRMSSRKNYCENCRIRPSDMTTSPNLSTLYAAQEAAEDAAAKAEGSLEDAQIVRDYAEGVREVQSMYEESAQNMEDGFGHATYQSEEIAEKAAACESFADELDSTADDIEGLEDPDAESESFLDDYDGETDDENVPCDEDEWTEFVETKRAERRDALLDALADAISEGPEL